MPPAMKAGGVFGASDLTRTGDLLITSEMHYRLCYTSIRPVIISGFALDVNSFIPIVKNRKEQNREETTRFCK